MSVIDLSMPLSDVLRESIRMAYEDAEVSPAATTMLRGELDKEEYIRFLMMLWHIYNTFERSLERHQHHPVLEPTYDPALLACARPLSADIAHLLDVESSWKAHSIHTQLLAEKPPALEAYTARIQAIADLPDPSALLAHSYVRYIGDLSGGQTIQRALTKAYGLTLGGAGLSFYAFKELHSNKPASQSEMKRIRDWFRTGMNKGAGDNVEVKAAVMEEASRVFEFTSEIFKAVNLEKANPKVVYYADPRAPRMYFPSVLAVIIAVCVAHFVLTAGGIYQCLAKSGPGGPGNTL
ncbi:hypothetical protein B0H14DRAFT_554548 [Mycena olivaceomarginata]|nr:hypothetical protein B0H14DRAFT_554548 [Mycena olivaceomarginata]